MHEVALAYPHSNEVGHNFHASMMQLVAYDFENGRHLGPSLTIRCNAGGVDEARNKIAADLCTMDERVQWVWWQDTDMGFAPYHLARLLEVADPVQRPIVGALCFAWKEVAVDGLGGFHCVPRPTLFDWVEHDDGHKRFTGKVDWPRDEVIQVAGTGTGSLLIHRSVMEAIAENADDQGQWFDRLRGSDGGRLGEDISFCVRATALGFPIHVDTSLKTNHLKQLWVDERVFDQQMVIARIAAQVSDAGTGEVTLEPEPRNRAERRAASRA